MSAYTPKEYLLDSGVDIDAECRRFVSRLIEAVASTKARNVLSGHRVVDELVPLYRLILLDEVDVSIAHIVPPPML